MILFKTLSTSYLFGFFHKTHLVVMVMRLNKNNEDGWILNELVGSNMY